MNEVLKIKFEEIQISSKNDNQLFWDVHMLICYKKKSIDLSIKAVWIKELFCFALSFQLNKRRFFEISYLDFSSVIRFIEKVKPVLANTSEQRPIVNRNRSDSQLSKINCNFNFLRKNLWITTTFEQQPLFHWFTDTVKLVFATTPEQRLIVYNYLPEPRLSKINCNLKKKNFRITTTFVQ